MSPPVMIVFLIIPSCALALKIAIPDVGEAAERTVLDHQIVTTLLINRVAADTKPVDRKVPQNHGRGGRRLNRDADGTGEPDSRANAASVDGDGLSYRQAAIVAGVYHRYGPTRRSVGSGGREVRARRAAGAKIRIVPPKPKSGSLVRKRLMNPSI